MDGCGCGTRAGWSLKRGGCCQGARTTVKEAECCKAGGRPEPSLRAFVVDEGAISTFDCLRSVNFMAKDPTPLPLNAAIGDVASKERGGAAQPKSMVTSALAHAWTATQRLGRSHGGGVLVWGASAAALLLLGACSVASVVKRASPKRSQQVLVADGLDEEEASLLYTSDTREPYAQQRSLAFAHTHIDPRTRASKVAEQGTEHFVDVTVGSPSRLMQLQDSDV